MANHYAYPESIGNDVKQGQHYILFSSYESRSAVAASTKVMSSIALYIPPNSLTTTIQQNYQELEGGTSRAILGTGTEDTGIIAGIKNIFSEQGTKNIGTILENQADKRIKQLGDFRAAASGLATNNRVALTYRGPQGFRDHSFTFQFFPKSAPEAEEVRQIIGDFQNGSTPRRVESKLGAGDKLLAPYFASPRQWTIKFIAGKLGGGPGSGPTSGGENPYLPKIQRSVISSFMVNHDPDSVISFHRDGSPVHSTLTLTFKEIVHVTSADPVSDQFADTQATEPHSQALKPNYGPHSQSARVQATSGLAAKYNITPASIDPHAHVSQGMDAMRLAREKQKKSDFRLKDNITLLQGERFGIPNIYSFNYKWDAETTWIGVMAQELLDTGYSDAVGIDSEGFYNVDYSKLGFPMIGFK